VNIITATNLRRLLPVSAVAAALAFAYIAPLPVDASKINNCGVKGGYAYGGYAFAFHDHGKPCPNRPFPGKGKGVSKFLITGATPPTTTTTSRENVNAPSTDKDGSLAIVASDTQPVGKNHVHGKGHGRGKGAH